MKIYLFLVVFGLINNQASAMYQASPMLSDQQIKGMGGGALTTYILLAANNPEQLYGLFNLKPHPSENTIFQQRIDLRDRSRLFTKCLKDEYYVKIFDMPKDEVKRVSLALDVVRGFYWDTLIKSIFKRQDFKAVECDYAADPNSKNELSHKLRKAKF